MKSNALILNLLPQSETDYDVLSDKLGAVISETITGSDIRERGAKAGLDHLRKLIRESGAGILAVHTRDWNRQSQRSSLFMLALLSGAKRRVAIETNGEITELTWPGYFFREFPNSVLQKIRGNNLVNVTLREITAELKKGAGEYPKVPDTIERILYMRTDLWFGVKAGGSIGHVAGVIDGFRKAGVSVHVMSWARPTLVDTSVPLTRVVPDPFFTNEREHSLLAYNHRLIESADFQCDCVPEAVYARYSLDCYAPASIAKHLGVPLILEYNGSEVWIEEHWGRGLKYPEVAELIEDRVLKSSAMITVVSKPLKDQLVEMGIDESRVLVNPNAVDPERFDPSRYSEDDIDLLKAELGIRPGLRVAGFIGTFSPWHGVEVLAHAIPLALSKNTKLHFLLIGAGPLFDKVRDQLKVAGVDDRVTMTGLIPQDEAPRYLMCSDFFLSPHVPNADGTPFFGSPTKLFEYMALGKGIIASDLDQLGDILENEKTALLVKPGDAMELATAIDRFCEDMDFAGKLGANAREEALSEHTWEAHSRRILDHLYSLNETE